MKNSARNWALSRSPNFQALATEKSQLRKPESGNRLRPMVPKVPSAGGIITELPFMKQPSALSELTPPGPSAAAAAVQAGGRVGLQGNPPKPKQGIGVGPDLKSFGFPMKSQRSGPEAGGLTGNGPLKLTSLPRSMGPQGWELARVTMELSCQPSSSCPKPFFPGMA